MQIKTDENGVVALDNGLPVYIKDDGTESPFDAKATLASITRLNAEARDHRKRADAAEARLKDFDGLDDPAAARKAMETLGNLDAKKLIDAGEVDKVKSEITKVWQTKLDEATTKANGIEKQLYNEMIGGGFSRSKFVQEKMAIPADMVQSHFGRFFSVNEGQVVAQDTTGNPIYSATRPGELAAFDEALSILVSQYPNKDHILKGAGSSGGGATGGSGGKTMKRSEMSPTDVREYTAKHGRDAYLQLPK